MQNSYFQQLRQEFKNNPYQDRFLQELQHHAEDLESELPKSKKLTPDAMKKHFGEPKEVKKNFTQITRPWKKGLEIVEVLGWGIVIIGLILILPAIMYLVNDLFLWFSISLSFLTLVQISLTCIILWFAYLFLWRFLIGKNYTFLSAKKVLFWGILPQVLWLPFLIWKLYRHWNRFREMPDGYYITLSAIAIVVGLLAFWWAYRKPISSQKATLKKLSLFSSILGPLSFTYILSFSLIRVLNPYFRFTTYSPFYLGKWWEFLLTPIDYADQVFFIDLPSSLFISFLGTHYFQVFLVIIILITSMAYFLVKRQFSWLASGALIYAIVLLFVPQQDQLLEFQTPYIQVSEAIEREQYGPFYNMVNYLEGRSPDRADYFIQSEGNTFAIRQYDVSGRTRSLEKVNLEPTLGKDFIYDPKKAIFERIESFNFQIPTNFAQKITPINIPINITCKEEGEIKEDIFKETGICQTLLFNGQELLTKKLGEFRVNQFAVSKDGNWLMISLEEYGTKIYLLDLREINSTS